MGDDARRERKRFEPPPWEKDAFEALAAKRAEQARAEMALRGADAADAADVNDADGAVDAADAAADAADAAGAAPDGAALRAAPNENAVAAMMLELSRQETTDGSNAKAVGWVASGVTAVIGIAMAIAGIALGSQNAGKATGMLGSAVLTVFGLVFAGMAVWVWISTSRVRGR